MTGKDEKTVKKPKRLRESSKANEES